VHPIMNGDNVHLFVKRTPEFQGHVTPQNARKTRSFTQRKRRIAHSFPLTAFKIKGKWREGGTKLCIPYLWGRGEEVFCLDNLPLAMLASGKGNWHGKY
jgi:hypothetical protein